MPERFDRVRLCAPLLSDHVLDIALGACEAVELVLKRSDPGLADTRFLQLRQGFLGEVLESGAIDLALLPRGDVGRYRETQVSPLTCASALNSSRFGISIWSICPHFRRPGDRLSCPIERCWLKHRTPALIAINQGGISNGQANAQQAVSPIRACPHSRSPQSCISFRIGETGFPNGMAKSQIFTGIMTK